jgi:hypothetical protein
VNASSAQANLPFATARPETRGLALGAVGDFVFVDCESTKLLGRILEIKIPDGERLSVEPQFGEPVTPHPIGRIQLLASLRQGANVLTRGLQRHPRIGDGVYLAEPTLLSEIISNSVSKDNQLTLAVGRIDASDGIEVRLPPETIFGRHCGVFGATGGGKSWTVASLIHQVKKAGGKAIVFDPTGEFSGLQEADARFAFDVTDGFDLVHFPYRQMTEDDLFSLLRPSGQSQGPKLRDAIKSLKLVQSLNGTVPNGLNCNGHTIVKANALRAPYFDAMRIHAAALHSAFCNFDIEFLADQIRHECVWQSAQGNVAPSFGAVETNALGYCESMISRVGTAIHSKELECIFKTNGASLVSSLNEFLGDKTKDIAVISFKEVRFEHHTREVLLNIIGRYLLGLARRDRFKERPIIVFLDEAHQFLGRTVGDEYGSVRLDSFGLIAKEGRKYGLTCVLATQRPRDIPQDVLSQLGTLFVHRLTNEHDRQTVESACGDLDRAAAQFIPMLTPGEAVLIGPDIPVPLPIRIDPPPSPPDSKGPPFQAYWRNRTDILEPDAQEPTPATVVAAPSTELDDDVPF